MKPASFSSSFILQTPALARYYKKGACVANGHVLPGSQQPGQNKASCHSAVAMCQNATVMSIYANVHELLKEYELLSNQRILSPSPCPLMSSDFQ
jgi:hypothetical protein